MCRLVVIELKKFFANLMFDNKEYQDNNTKIYI